MGMHKIGMAKILRKRIFARVTVIFLILVFLSGCSKIQPPVFKSISDVNVNVHNNLISINGNGLFFNPNKSRIFLKSAKIEVFLNDQSFTEIDRDYNKELSPEQDFTIPLDFQLKSDQVQVFLKKNAVQMLLGNQIHVKYKGNIKVKAFHVGMKVPVNHEISLSLKNFL